MLRFPAETTDANLQSCHNSIYNKCQVNALFSQWKQSIESFMFVSFSSFCSFWWIYECILGKKKKKRNQRAAAFEQLPFLKFFFFIDVCTGLTENWQTTIILKTYTKSLQYNVFWTHVILIFLPSVWPSEQTTTTARCLFSAPF